MSALDDRAQLGGFIIHPVPEPEESEEESFDTTFDFRDGRIYTHVVVTDFDEMGPPRIGRFGVVQSSTHIASGKRVAIKTVSLFNAKTKTIKKEADISRRLNHRNVITFYGMTAENFYCCLCFELMDVDLSTFYTHIYKDEKARLPENMIGAIASSMVNGLMYLKEQKIIHRDVKPSNVLLNRLGNVKICDFGVSGYLSRSVAKTYCGTSAYLAPEMVAPQNGGKTIYTVQADIWSLGITLYEISKGKHPYDPVGKSTFVLLSEIQAKEAPVLNDSYYSGNLCEFVNKCLNKDVLHRPFYRRKGSIRGLIDLSFYIEYRDRVENSMYMVSVIGNDVKNYLSEVSN
uniref:mitogen-activated protein kinase kinase n=1 Tax=Parascaris univalens TaxID=6257 RepID=A0A915C1Z5_PARUN